MPAAAVIPAPIAYIKVVAVKKLVVGSVSGRCRTTPSARRVAAGRVAGPRPVGAAVVALVGRIGVLVTGTSAGRIVGRRTRVAGLRRAARPRVARSSGLVDGGRLLQSCSRCSSPSAVGGPTRLL